MTRSSGSRRILITGADGFVGGHLCTTLMAEFPDATLIPAGFDVRDAGAMRAAVRDARPDACIHLAAVSSIPAAQADPTEAWQVNLLGTIGLARMLMAEAPECLLVFASTGDAYGASFRSGLPMTEDAALQPMNTYSATKAAADLALGAMANEGLRAVRMRAFNHAGPGQSEAFVVAAFARQVARIEAGLQAPVVKVGALDAERDFLDVRDVCRAYALCVARGDALKPGVAINVASGLTRRVGDILSALLDVGGVSATVEIEPGRLRRADIPVAVGDASQARALLGWDPRVAWETTLADIIADWRRRVLQG